MKDKWIKITERQPPGITPVLVYGWYCDVCYQIKIIENDEWWESETGDDLTFIPTHWQLIEPPTTE